MRVGDYELVQIPDRGISFIYSPIEPKKKEEKNYTEEDLLVYIHKLVSNWKALEKWLEEQKTDRKYANDVGRFTAYDATLDRMKELEASNPDVFCPL